MKIKTKLIISLVVEVLLIFILTEYVHIKIKHYQSLESQKSNLLSLKAAVKEVESAVKIGDEREKNLFLKKIRILISQNNIPDHIKPQLSRILGSQDLKNIKVLEGSIDSSINRIEKEARSVLNFASTLVVLIPLFSLIVIGIGAFTTYKAIVNPIKEMINIMQEIKTGNLNKTLSLNRTDELGTLGKEFDVFINLDKISF